MQCRRAPRSHAGPPPTTVLSILGVTATKANSAWETKSRTNRRTWLLGSTSARRLPWVCAGGIHSSAVTVDGGVFTWGCGSDGRLGHPEAEGHRYLSDRWCQGVWTFPQGSPSDVRIGVVLSYGLHCQK